MTSTVQGVPGWAVLACLGRSAPAFLVLLMCAVALRNALLLTRDLEWPMGDVQYREMASAPTLLDQGYGVAPTYRNEYPWYNPLPRALIAGVSYVTGLPVRVVIVRSGPYVNLLAPVTFFVMMAILTDAWSALAGTAAFLFISGNRPFEVFEAASYTPWFLTNLFAQSVLYLGTIVCYRASAAARRLRSHLMVGLLLGWPFLMHTAPALVFGCIVVVRAVIDASLTNNRVSAALACRIFGARR